MRLIPSAARSFLGGFLCTLLPAVTGVSLLHLGDTLGLSPLLTLKWASAWFLTQSIILALGFGDPRGASLRAERVIVYQAGTAFAMIASFGPLLRLGPENGCFLWPLSGMALLVTFRRWLLGDRNHLRGRKLISESEARWVIRALRPSTDRGLPWGGLRVPSSSAGTHFVAIGASGSGKTLTIRMLLGELLREVKPGGGRRALVYDAKRDAVSMLYGRKPLCPVKILNPFDRRSSRWAIAKDARSPAVCLQIAETLIRTEPGPNQFFSLAGIEIVAGVMVALNLACPGQWDLRDVILSTRDPEFLRHLLKRRPETSGPLLHFEEPRTLANILSTIRVRLAQLEPIAAAWSHAEDEVSLEEWVTGEMILVLGNDETTRVCLDALNRAMLRRAVELVLNGPETNHWRTLFALDEVTQAGKLDCLSPLLTKGRSKGASVILGFQDMDGLREVYDKASDEIVGQCATKALLRLESPNTAEWASKAVGDFERWERQVTTALAGNSTTHQRVKREVALPSEFLSLPAASALRGVTGYFVVPGVGAFRNTISPREIQSLLGSRAADVPDFLPRPIEEQYLKAITSEDRLRLGVEGQRKGGTDPGKKETDRLQIVRRQSETRTSELLNSGE